MSKTKETERDPLTGTQVISTVATGGGGGIFQARVGALYLANMLTGLPTAFSLHGCRVETVRFEARYTGAHTDDIYCQISRNGKTWQQFIQCKRGLNATAGDTDFIDSLQGIWRDFLTVEGTPFVRGLDVLVIATIAPATPANQAAKRLCELSRASVDLADFLLKLESKLFDRKHRDTWAAFKTVSQATLGDKYTEELVFELLQHLRVDIHDLANDSSQELSLVQALLTSGQPGDSGEGVWDGLFAYVQENGISVGTVTRQTWPSTAKAGLQEMVSRLSIQRGLGSAADRMSERALKQLSMIEAKLPNDAHIPRGDCVARLLATLDERPLAIVTGGPGAGKSAVISELAPLLRESGPLFFFRADELEAPSLGAIQSLQDLPDPVLSLSAMLHAGRPTVVIDSMEKILEGRNRGALEELLALVRQNKQARLCVTTRSYALNSLYLNFLSSLAHQVVDIPPLTDAEVAAAVAGSALEDAVARDAGVREVLRAPYYLTLAFTYIAAQETLPQASGNDLRRHLWKERVAPSKSPAGMATRRQAAFDEVCYQRTDRFAQFVDAPSDAEAVAALIQDSVLARDSTDRVAPAHDVLEDWSLIFRVEREVRSAERDWGALFAKLGSHAGMRRSLRSWTAQKSAVGDEDAYALLQAALRPDPAIPQLWRDEVAIGLLRSERVEELVAKLGSRGAFNNAALLQRLSHLLRVACKGPTSLDYSQLADDPANEEILARIGMAAPVGKAWDVMIALVAKAFPSLPSDAHGWVVQLAEDAIAHNAQWWESALMSLEERLLLEAKPQPELFKQALENILDRGTSSFTTSVVASLMTAHPSLVTEKMLGIFKCPWFFVDDFSRCQQEPLVLAIHGGHDGLDGERQKERIASKKLPHRRYNLEDLALQLQMSRLDLCDAIFAILDQHKAALPANPEDAQSWRIALKRMDLRELKVGKQVDGGRAVTLEVANLEPESQQASAREGERLQWMDRLSAIRLWATAITRPDISSDPNRADSFSSPTAVYDEFLKVREEFTGEDSAMLIGLQDELPCALIQRWPEDSSQALQWAQNYLIETTAQKPDEETRARRGHMEGELRVRTLVILASRSPSLPNMPTALANIVTEPVWKVRRAAANAISDVLRARQPELAAVLTWGLAHYAESLETMISQPRGRRRDLVDSARDASVKALLRALAKGKPGEMPVPTSLVAAKEWTIALDAARTESPGTWRVSALSPLVRLIADQEGKPRVDHHDPEHVDFEARWETGDLLASELLAQPSREGPAFELLAYCLKHAPELSERVLESTLTASMKQEYANAEAFWRVWDGAIAIVLADPSLRTRSRRSHSRFDKVLRTLLFCSVPWLNTRHDLPLLQRRPNFIAHCLRGAGDSRPALENLLSLMAGIGQTQAVPAAVPSLRDAIRSAPSDLFDDGNCLWNAETICRVAVHEHRPALMRDVTLRKATLDVLDRLVDAGSSLAFQLRDYLASSATTLALPSNNHQSQS